MHRHAPVAGIAILVAGLSLTALAEQPRSAVPVRPDDQTIVHVLNRVGFGPRRGDVQSVRRIGLQAYIEQQLNTAGGIDTQLADRLAGLETLTLGTRDLAQQYFLPAEQARRRAQQEAAPENPATMREMRVEAGPEMLAARRVMTDLQQQKVLRAVYSERQLEEVLVDFWFNHFNVFAGKGQTRVYLTEYERDTIRPRVFGRFRALLGAVAESPAMLFYLDNWQSSAPDTARPTPRRPAPMPNRRPAGINENYARELLELHTLGVDGGYTQKDVQEVARAFTGWTIAVPRQGGTFFFNPRMHDEREKVVLGQRIRAGGKGDGEQVLDLVSRHPSTARHIATKLARRFVSDDPPAALIDRAAARFTATDGDLREVVRTIVTSPEFFAPATRRAKVKTPFEFVVSAVRATGLETRNAMPLVQAVRQLGMPLYQCQPPTGYADRAEAWVNTGTLLNRMNFAVTLTSAPMRGVAGGQGRGLAVRLTPDEANAIRETLTSEVLAGDVSPSTAATVAKATAPQQAIALLLGAPEFQKR